MFSWRPDVQMSLFFHIILKCLNSSECKIINNYHDKYHARKEKDEKREIFKAYKQTYHTSTGGREDFERIGTVIEVCFWNSWNSFRGCEMVYIMPHLADKNCELSHKKKNHWNAYVQDGLKHHHPLQHFTPKHQLPRLELKKHLILIEIRVSTWMSWLN